MRILQALHLAVGMQLFPGVGALPSLAGLEHHHQSVQSRQDSVKTAAANVVGRSWFGVGEVVVDLAGVELSTCVKLSGR